MLKKLLITLVKVRLLTASRKMINTWKEGKSAFSARIWEELEGDEIKH